jgi:hypothetical protein
MKKAYDRHDAKRLVPLLETIAREISERVAAIQELEERSAAPRRPSQRLHDQAELAIHRRELRLARKELETLGCSNDEAHPTEVLIPGRDGNLEHGFRWQFGDEGIRTVASDSRRV